MGPYLLSYYYFNLGRNMSWVATAMARKMAATKSLDSNVQSTIIVARIFAPFLHVSLPCSLHFLRKSSVCWSVNQDLAGANGSTSVDFSGCLAWNCR